MNFINKDDFADFNLDEFLGFRKLISPIILKIVYLLGIIGLLFFSLYIMFANIHSFQQFLVQFLIGIGIFIFGNLSWRISCEILMVIFNILGELKKANQR